MLKNNQIRINKYLSQIGLGSRRKIDQLIIDEKIKVNRQLIKPGFLIKPQKDQIYLNNRLLQLIEQKKIYYLLNKPKGYLSSTVNENKYTSVLKLISNLQQRLFIIGRLDLESEGLMILTNDGWLTEKLTHPSNHIEKTYQIVVIGNFTKKVKYRIQNGVLINKSYLTKSAKLTVLESNGPKHLLEISICEGKHQQLRKMCGALNLKILSLIRTSIGNLSLKKMKLNIGENRIISQKEIYNLTQCNLTQQ